MNPKISVPAHKAGGPKTQPAIKTGSAVKGFGGGSATHKASHVGAGDTVKTSRSIKGFSGGGTKGAKV